MRRIRDLSPLCLVLGLVLFVLALRGRVLRADDDTRKNLIVIQTDEHNFRTLGCYRQLLSDDQAYIWGPKAFVETPAIDALARDGLLCTSYYATSPVCTPSRASLFTGLYPQHTGAPQNNLPLKNGVATFASVLSEQGYATGYAGKWHLDGEGKPQWAPDRQFGFSDNRFMFNRGHWKKFELLAGQPRVAARQRGNPTYSLAGADSESFATDWLMSRAIDFVKQHASQPFCYHLSLPDPHGPNTVRAPYDTMFTDMVIRPPLTFSQTNYNPQWGLPQGKNGTASFRADLMTQYFGMVKCIDDNVSRLLEELDNQGITEKTIVVFTSDHGDLCYEHGRLNKGVPYEASARIPMIIKAPGVIKAGQVVDQALGTVDFLPTIVTLLDSPAPQNVQGRDFSGLIELEASDALSTATWQDMTVMRNAGLKASWLAAVSDRYKLVLSTNDKPWLFDLQSDPDELRNAYGLAENSAIIRELASHLLEYGQSVGDPFLDNPTIAGQLHQALAVRASTDE